MTNMRSYPSRADRHKHPMHPVYILEVNAEQGWRRWLKVFLCDECSHKEWTGLTYNEPPKELIWREENGEIKPPAKTENGKENEDGGGETIVQDEIPEIPHTPIRDGGVGESLLHETGQRDDPDDGSDREEV